MLSKVDEDTKICVSELQAAIVIVDPRFTTGGTVRGRFVGQRGFPLRPSWRGGLKANNPIGWCWQRLR